MCESHQSDQVVLGSNPISWHDLEAKLSVIKRLQYLNQTILEIICIARFTHYGLSLYCLRKLYMKIQ